MTTKATTSLHPAEQYIADVTAGKIVVCKWVRKAVERHLRDLKTAEARGLKFERAAAERAIKFFRFLKHSKGKWAGDTFELTPWQQFILWCLFGWKVTMGERAGKRRFRTAYVKVARKNGKSTFAAGVGLYLFIADGEQGAEVYTAATKREQARIVHREAIMMVKKSTFLKQRVEVYKDNLSIPEKNSKFEPLGADEGTDDGRSPSGAIIDELHAHKTRGSLDVLDSGTGAREQALLFIITTAGVGTLGVDQDTHKYSEKVLEGVIEDDSWFAIIFMIEDSDDWRDESCWVKANPNLGISAGLEDLRAKCRKAINMPSAQNEFLCKHMNRQTAQVTRWIPMEKWDACRETVPLSAFAGRRCYVGLDLSSKLDVTAAVYLFPPSDEDSKWRIIPQFYVPKDTAHTRERDARVPYATWGSEGHLKLTPGNVVDYEFIKADVFEAACQFEIAEVAYDPWNAEQIAIQLQGEGLTAVSVIQGFRSLTEPSKEFERLVTSLQIGHSGNPVMDWMVSNVSTETDAAGNIKPSKKHSSEKIDGVAATVTAMARALMDGGVGSAYDEKDLLVL